MDDERAKPPAAADMPPGLRHADDAKPGITRKRENGGFAYFDVAGKRIDDEDENQNASTRSQSARL